MKLCVRLACTVWFLVIALAPKASAEEQPGLSALLDIFREYRTKLADKNIYGLEQSTYAKVVWRFRQLVGSPYASDGVLFPPEVELLKDTRKVRLLGAKLSEDSKDEALHRQLIAAGLLEAEIGHVSIGDFRESVMGLRRAMGVDTFGGLDDKERAEVARVANEVEQFAKFEDVKSNDKYLGGNLRIPTALVSPVPDPENTNLKWRIYSSADKRIRIHNFVQGSQANTPLSLAGSLLPDEADGGPVWRRIFFNEITSDDFLLETATRTGKGRTFLNNAAGWSRANRVLGLKFTADWDPLPDVARTVPKLPNPEPKAAEGLTDDQKLAQNWERLTKAIWNLMLGDYKRLNGWKVAQAGSECVNSRESHGQWIAVVYAADRKEHEKFKASQAPAANIRLTADELFSSEPDRLLHIGCARVWVPDNYRLEYDLRGRIGSGEPGTPSNLRYQHYDVAATPIYRGFEVREDIDLDFIDPVKNKWTKAMLFVHGYNNSFADAVLRAAQMAAAADFKGRVYAFSWPSRESQWSYLPSIDIAEQAEIDLQYFLKLILSRTKGLELDIVAHSMGSQILLRALGNRAAVFDRRQGDERTDRVRLRNLIFAAPDVADIVFQRKIPDIAMFARTVTVFASGCDGAIAFSKLLRGNNPRAGGVDSRRRPIELPEEAGRVDVVDVTYASGGRYCSGNLKRFIGANHSAFAFETEILEQIKGILSTDRVIKSPPDRASKDADYEFAECLYPSSRPDNKRAFWVLKSKSHPVDACPATQDASRQ